MATLFKTPKRPAISAPTPAPTPNSAEIDQATRRRAAIARQSSGYRAAQAANQPGVRETLG